MNMYFNYYQYLQGVLKTPMQRWVHDGSTHKYTQLNKNVK